MEELLSSLSLLCQGALVTHALDEGSSLGKNAENALRKMGWPNLDDDTKRSLTPDPASVSSVDWWRQPWTDNNKIDDLLNEAEEEWNADSGNSSEKWPKVRELIQHIADGSVPNVEQISEAYLALDDRL